MKLTTVTSAILLGTVPATACPSDTFTSQVSRRALSSSPNGYTPSRGSCPATRPSIRRASTLSLNESSWLQIRRQETIQPLKDLLGRLNITSFDANSYIDNHKSNLSNLPNIGIAVSGGGYRALTNGAGAIKAFDGRTYNATTKGHIGGILQAATYVAGLSGGGWLVGSVYLNNFTTIDALQTTQEGSLWNFEQSILLGPKGKGIKILNTVEYWEELGDAVGGKADAGFATTITDYWGRALSYQLINATNGGPDYTWSSIALTDAFKSASMPLPILIADGRASGEKVIGSNSTVYEFNPWEFGSFDPTVFGFAPLEYLGSKFQNGELSNNRSCVRGFDNAGFVMGTSSSLFNQFILRLNSTDLPDFVKSAFNKILTELDQNDEDIAIYSPNPFYQYRNATAAYSTDTDLDVVDGGEDNQNIPLHPLIQPVRHLDVVFAVDSSADTNYNWPDGASLVATYERSLNSSGIGNGTAFPAVPDKNTFINLGLNSHPTFFGCDAANTTGSTPLIVYLPNAPYSAYSNTSTFQLSYQNSQRDAIITNGYEVVTRGNGTQDESWPTCVGCAIISRSLSRTNTTVPDVCNQCFQKYCWNGTVDSRTPGNYEPKTLLSTSSSGTDRSQLNWIVALVTFAMMIFVTV